MESFTRKPITLICVQPCQLYYAWQIEVMLTNFEKLKIHNEFNIQCLFAFNKNNEQDNWKENIQLIQLVEEKFKGIAEFYYYPDTRKTPFSYISSIRPNILKQHFAQYKHLQNDSIFYHDCDIVFTKFPEFLKRLTQVDNNWYVSDTKGYIGHDYIKSKGEDVLNKMCEIVGINRELVERKEYQSGGAQYLLKGVDSQFFNKMEEDCERLFKEITQLNVGKKSADATYHELQIWAADMWAILWGAWMRGYHTNIIPELDFCWSTDPIENWDKKFIFHNAGVINAECGLFYKGLYTHRLPYNQDLKILENSASKKYYDIIQSVEKNSCLK